MKFHVYDADNKKYWGLFTEAGVNTIVYCYEFNGAVRTKTNSYQDWIEIDTIQNTLQHLKNSTGIQKNLYLTRKTKDNTSTLTPLNS